MESIPLPRAQKSVFDFSGKDATQKANNVLKAFYLNLNKNPSFTQDHTILNQAHAIVGRNPTLQQKWRPYVQDYVNAAQSETDKNNTLWKINKSDSPWLRKFKGAINTADAFSGIQDVRHIVSGRTRHNIQNQMLLQSLENGNTGGMLDTDAGVEGVIDAALAPLIATGAGKVTGIGVKKVLVPELLKQTAKAKKAELAKNTIKATTMAAMGTGLYNAANQNSQVIEEPKKNTIPENVQQSITEAVNASNKPTNIQQPTNVHNTPTPEVKQDSEFSNYSSYLNTLKDFAKTDQGKQALLGLLLGGAGGLGLGLINNRRRSGIGRLLAYMLGGGALGSMLLYALSKYQNK